MPFILDAALDAGLNAACNPAENFYICSQEPTTFAEASSTFALGVKASPSIGAAEDAPGGGRRRVVASFTDGTATATGTATHWALTDNSASTLLATGSLSSSQAITSGNDFTAGALNITMRDAT